MTDCGRPPPVLVGIDQILIIATLAGAWRTTQGNATMHKLATIVTAVVQAFVCHLALATTFHVGPDDRITNNHIHHVMRELHDGGAIYTLGNQPGTLIAGNHIHDNSGGPGGIYLDEGSGFIEITGNRVYQVPRPMNYNNRAQNRIQTCREHDNAW